MSKSHTPHGEVWMAPCPQCGGDKGFESEPWGVNYQDGSPLTSWIPCTFCGATGEVETEPASEDDMLGDGDTGEDTNCEDSYAR